jgi:hypothetical protein
MRKQPKDYEEPGLLPDEAEAYGAEDEDEDRETHGMSTLGKRGRKRGPNRQTSMAGMSAKNAGEEEAEGSDEERYGLRRKKRQRIDKAEVKSSIAANQQSSANLQEKVDSLCAPKVWLQFSKRNEKNGIVCAHCMQPET